MPLSQIALVNDAERRKVVVEWNRTTTDYAQRSLQELFEEQVDRAPDAIALEFEDQHVSYAELNRRANQVAHWLRERGVGPDIMVGLCAERGIEMLVGMLAIVKAGGAYVPLDPSYPPSRLAFMLEDTATTLVLTQNRYRHLFAATTLCLDSEWEQVSHCSTANPAPSAGLDHLAYLIYTSGSTGQPKAALIPQRGVVRLVKATNYVNLTSDEVILQFAPISFDASTFEIWGALLNGGRLVVFPAHTPSLEELGRVIRERGITTLWLTAALFHQMIEQEGASLNRTPATARWRRSAIGVACAGGAASIAGLPADQRIRTHGEHDLHLLRGSEPGGNCNDRADRAADREYAGVHSG